MLTTIKGNVGSIRHGPGDWDTLSLSIRPKTVAAEAMEGVVWMVVEGFEPQCAMIFSVGISIKIVLLAQFCLV